MPADVRVEKERNYITGSRTLRIKVQLQHHLAPAALLADFLPNSSLHLPTLELSLEGASFKLRNMRGRPRETFAQPPVPEGTEQLLSVAGEISVPAQSEEELPEIKQQLAPLELPFALELHSRFSCFAKNSILYQVTPQLTLPPVFLEQAQSLTELLRLPLACFSRVAVGFECFRSSFLGSLIGLVPVVYARFFLEVSTAGLQLSCEETAAAKSSFLPLAADLAALDKALETTANFSGLLNLINEKRTVA